MNDTELHQDVLDQLEFVPGIEAPNIHVAVNDGIVTLSVHVTSYGQKMKVERATRRAKVVRCVDQRLEMKPPESVTICDDEIMRRAINMLMWNSMMICSAIAVAVGVGWLKLSGE